MSFRGHRDDAAGLVGTLWQRQRSEAVDRAHRDRFDARAEWWRRFQWAAEQSCSDNRRSCEMGLSVILALTESPLITSSELGILAATANLVENGASNESDRGDEE